MTKLQAIEFGQTVKIQSDELKRELSQEEIINLYKEFKEFYLL